MRIIRTSIEMEMVCDICMSRLGIVPADVRIDGEFPFVRCPACGINIDISDRVPPKWETLLGQRVINEG
jgi:predicted Zn finger-like uncharacterized protein